MKAGKAPGAALVLALMISPSHAFHGGHTGVVPIQLKSACPAFAAGSFTLHDSFAPPGALPMTDIFEHESGARCICTRQRADKFSVRCSPAAASRRPRG